MAHLRPAASSSLITTYFARAKRCLQLSGSSRAAASPNGGPPLRFLIDRFLRRFAALNVSSAQIAVIPSRARFPQTYGRSIFR
jgi:hypothetical protein